MYDVELKQLPPEKIMYNRVETTLADAMVTIPQAFDELYTYLVKAGATLAGRGYSIYHTMDMTDGKFDQECAFTVAEFVPETDRIHARTLPGGLVATLLHRGPYDQMAGAYARLEEWVRDNGYELNGDMIESSLNKPDNPADTMVEIIWPIKKL